MIDVMEYITKREERLIDVPVISQEDQLFLEEVNRILAGFQKAITVDDLRYCEDCYADISWRNPNAKYCPECATSRMRASNLAYYHAKKKYDRIPPPRFCVDCGASCEKPRVLYCPDCKAVREAASRQERGQRYTERRRLLREDAA